MAVVLIIILLMDACLDNKVALDSGMITDLFIFWLKKVFSGQGEATPIIVK